jgi:AdoMet-dependent rRNA methyltransferase SPB1
VAKEQGFRSRAAFKLTQINRKFNILQNARTIIDLCAAPGGWTQVCARSLPNDSTTTILAVDILPIRNLNSKNVITLIGDITTEKCKAAIRAEMQGAGADVVLCDGAPNVGASYDRDAYDQNELALHALKCACEHLRKNGTFVSKLYRSADYSAYLWVAKQFFDTVQAVKPSASRSQSAEIFLVCQGYVAPDKIDPRMFDPKCVFEQVDGQATGGGDKAQTGEKAAKMNIFHKEFGKKVRSRNGYDMSNLDASMRNIGSVANFLEGGSSNDPIQMLSDCTGLAFLCHVCKDVNAQKVEEPSCNCTMYLNHRLTTAEIKTCLSDLKVLNKSDFKGMLLHVQGVRSFIRYLCLKSFISNWIFRTAHVAR